MAETPSEIRREIEVTRERVGSAIAALERKVNPKQAVEDYIDGHPLATVGIAFGIGALLGATGSVGRAAHEIRDKAADGAASLQHRAGSEIDRVLHAVVETGAAILTAKATRAIEIALGAHLGNGSQNGSGNGARA